MDRSAMNKQRNNAEILAALRISVSPPPVKRRRLNDRALEDEGRGSLTTAAVEAGIISIDNHITYSIQHLSTASRRSDSEARLSIADYKNMFLRNQHDDGCHFVIHQHDHPIAGTHYDLRLQINACSSVSWAIMYGLPGDPNSKRLNRNATETRVHCLWNHLIETASMNTGSLLIWETGEYEVLPYKRLKEETDIESNAGNNENGVITQSNDPKSQPAQLQESFRKGKIRLRLNGAKLPENYTITLRIAASQPHYQQSGPTQHPRKRRRRRVHTANAKSILISSEDEAASKTLREVNSTQVHSDHEEDDETRQNNAYAGSINSIGSIYQRTWYLSMDGESSGFERRRGPDGVRWTRRQSQGRLHGFEPFRVGGREAERSVVTGRLGADVLMDESVLGYVGRPGWRPVLE